MKPRSKPLVIPKDNPRYWSVDMPLKGVHVFRHPFYGVGAAMSAAMSTQARPEGEVDTRSIQEQSAALLPVAGMMIGGCWWHPLHEFETPFPKVLNTDTLLEYGTLIADELQEAGYDILDMMDLLGKVTPEMTKRQSVISMGEQRAAFSSPQGGSSTVS